MGSVLDFTASLQTAETAIGVILCLLFDVAVRCPGGGRPNPVVVIVEEAHRYLGDESAGGRS